MNRQEFVESFLIDRIPDPGDRVLSSACGGDVRKAALTAAEQTLRMIASGDTARDLRVELSFDFDPKRRPRSARTIVRVSIATSDEALLRATRKIFVAGPLAELYPSLAEGDTGDAAGPVAAALPAYGYEILRRWRAETPFLYSDNVEEQAKSYAERPEFYWALDPFKPRDDQDWSALDRLLDRFERRATVQIVVAPVDISREKEVLHRTLAQLHRSERASYSSGADTGSGWQARLVQRQNEKLYEELDKPHLAFSVQCRAETREESRLLAALVAESCLEDGAYLVAPTEDSPEPVTPRQRRVRDEIIASLRERVKGELPRSLERLLTDRLDVLAGLGGVATADELVPFFRLPVAHGTSSPRTVARQTDPKPTTEQQTILLGDSLEAGAPAPRRWPVEETGIKPALFEPLAEHAEGRIGLSLLTKHLFVSGVTGSGKTTAMFNLLAQLALHGIPFLVIEPAKTEYRVLKLLGSHPDPVIRALAGDLRVFSVGDERLSPFRFNPLWHPESTSTDEHIDTVLSCFEAAMPLGGPLQGVLAEALELVYDEPRGGRKPRLRDLADAAERVLEKKKYSGEVHSNIRAALEVRLGLLVRRSLGRVFDCDEGVPGPEELFGQNVILELDHLTPAYACLVTLFVLSSMREHLRGKERSGANLSHVTFLEEAHNIVGRSGPAKASEEFADPKAFAAEYVVRMLAEVRALGEGIVIADQLPSAVAPEIVKNTATKLAHRLVANEDREDLGGTMLMSDSGIEEMARLGVGEAFLFTEGLHRPLRIRAVDANAYLALRKDAPADEARRLPSSPTWKVLREQLEKEKWYSDARARRNTQRFEDLSRSVTTLTRAVGWAEEILTEARTQREREKGGARRNDANSPDGLKAVAESLRACYRSSLAKSQQVLSDLGELRSMSEYREKSLVLSDQFREAIARSERLTRNMEAETKRPDATTTA